MQYVTVSRKGSMVQSSLAFERKDLLRIVSSLFWGPLGQLKHKNRAISIILCDLAKAYNSVCQELLYTKLQSVSFGGKLVSLIRSMYYNDCVWINLFHGLTDQLFFTKGVKQGCSLSPMLFSFYIANLGDTLNSTNLGVCMGQ